jgi:hypothetical protein
LTSFSLSVTLQSLAEPLWLSGLGKVQSIIFTRVLEGQLGAETLLTTYNNDPPVRCVLPSSFAPRAVLRSALWQVVTSIPTRNGATSGGTYFAIAGTNFGTINLSPTLMIGGSACVSLAWASNTMLRCTAPSGLGEGAPLLPPALPPVPRFTG